MRGSIGIGTYRFGYTCRAQEWCVSLGGFPLTIRSIAQLHRCFSFRDMFFFTGSNAKTRVRVRCLDSSCECHWNQCFSGRQQQSVCHPRQQTHRQDGQVADLRRRWTALPSASGGYIIIPFLLSHEYFIGSLPCRHLFFFTLTACCLHAFNRMPTTDGENTAYQIPVSPATSENEPRVPLSNWECFALMQTTTWKNMGN